MKKQILKSALMAVVGVGLLAGGANAAFIDFTNASIFGGLDAVGTQTNFTTTAYAPSGIATLSLNASGIATGTYDLTFNGGTGEAPGAFTLAGNTFMGQGDGIGINSDQINFGEILSVTLAPKQTVTGIYFLDLNNGEAALYNFNSGTWSSATGNSIATLGKFGVSFDEVYNVLSITVEPGNSTSSLALAGIEYSPVPEPATMLLFGTGIAGLAGIARRRKTN